MTKRNIVLTDLLVDWLNLAARQTVLGSAAAVLRECIREGFLRVAADGARLEWRSRKVRFCRAMPEKLWTEVVRSAKVCGLSTSAYVRECVRLCGKEVVERYKR